MTSFRRVVSTATTIEGDGSFAATARVDDWFHGFEVTIEGRDGVAERVGASTHRHPWTTCPGALASTVGLAGPVGTLARAAVSQPSEATCVHINDLIWLAARLHPQRRYEIDVTPRSATLARDGAPLLEWKLDGWRIDGTGRFRGLGFGGEGWPEALDDVGAGGDLREAVRVMRRGVMVAMGYFELDWRRIRVGTDVPADVMADTCHTFSSPRVSVATCLVEPPERRAAPR